MTDFVYMQDTKIKKLKDILLYSVIFWLAAHGYRFMNNLYTGDTLGSVFQDDIWWQRSLGRFMQPVSMIFRGVIVSPWLLAIISVAFFTLSVFLISEILKIEDRVVLFFICGILSCNITVTCALAAYTPWIDIYMTAFFFAVLGVYLFTKDKISGYVLGCVCFAVSMGFYQAYICVAFVLFAILYIRDLSEKKPDKAFRVRTGKTVVSVLLSGGLYLVLYKLVLKIHNVDEAISYNSLSNMGVKEGVSFGSLLTGTYERYVHYLTHQGTFVSTYLLGRKVSDAWDVLIVLCFIAVIIITVMGLVIINRKNKSSKLQIILQIVLIVLFPLFSNVIYIISNGMEYELMIFAFYFVYVLFMLTVAKTGCTGKKMFIALIPVIILIWHSIVFSNQVYMKIDMEDRAALSIATRIADDINGFEGYEPAVTPVKVIGSLETSDYYWDTEYLKDVEIHGNYNTPFNYPGSFPYYMSVYLNERINFSYDDIPYEEYKDMPDYPAEGSIRFVDDILVIKLSD